MIYNMYMTAEGVPKRNKTNESEVFVEPKKIAEGEALRILDEISAMTRSSDGQNELKKEQLLSSYNSSRQFLDPVVRLQLDQKIEALLSQAGEKVAVDNTVDIDQKDKEEGMSDSHENNKVLPKLNLEDPRDGEESIPGDEGMADSYEMGIHADMDVVKQDIDSFKNGSYVDFKQGNTHGEEVDEKDSRWNIGGRKDS